MLLAPQHSGTLAYLMRGTNGSVSDCQLQPDAARLHVCKTVTRY
jgi:hypothetical protein